MPLGTETLLSMGIITRFFIFILAVWTIAWKGFALWIASKENKKPWFIALLVLNSAGILEIIYIFFFSATGKKCIADWKEKRAARKAYKKSKASRQHKKDLAEQENDETEERV